MAQKKRAKRSEATRLADLVRQAVDDGATTAEEIHKTIAALPLDVLQRLDLSDKTVKDVKRIQDSSIGAVYDAIRSVNREVTQLAAEILAPARKRRPSRKAPAKKATRASATA